MKTKVIACNAIKLSKNQALSFDIQLPSLMPNSDNKAHYLNHYLGILSRVSKSLIRLGFTDTTDIRTCLSEMLENAYDAIISIADNNLIIENRTSNYIGHVKIKIDLGLYKNKKVVIISVEDNGLGNLSATASDKNIKSINYQDFYFGSTNSGIKETLKLFTIYNQAYYKLDSSEYDETFTGTKTSKATLYIPLPEK